MIDHFGLSALVFFFSRTVCFFSAPLISLCNGSFDDRSATIAFSDSEPIGRSSTGGVEFGDFCLTFVESVPREENDITL